QPVHVWNRFRINRLQLGECCNSSLGSPTDGPCDVKLGPRNASCWKDEPSQRLQPGMNRINRLLQIINMGLANARYVCADQLRGKIPPESEKILLNAFQNLPGLRILYNRSGQSYLRIQFVNRSICFYPRFLLSDPDPAVDTRLS